MSGGGDGDRSTGGGPILNQTSIAVSNASSTLLALEPIALLTTIE